MHYFTFTFILLCAFFPALSCYANGNENKLPFSTLEKEAGRYNVNPSPQSHYKMTFILNNAPGLFNHIKSSAQYEAPNCTFLYNKTIMASSHPNKDIPIKLIKISDNQYQAEFYTDIMKDEDYYGQGVCHWVFRGVSTSFIADNDKVDTWFDASILQSDLDTGKKEYAHLKQYYPTRERFAAYLARGLKKSAFTPDEYFTINIKMVKTH